MLVDDVVEFVAVEPPYSRIPGDKLDIACLPWGDVDRGAWPLGRFGDWPPFRANHCPGIAVDVDGVAAHAQVSPPNAHALALMDRQDGNAWGDPSVKCEPVEVHGGKVGRRIAWLVGPLLKENAEVAIDLFRWLFGVDDKHPREAIPLLLRHIEAGVVHEGANLVESEFVGETLSWHNRRLRDTCCAIHCIW